MINLAMIIISEFYERFCTKWRQGKQVDMDVNCLGVDLKQARQGVLSEN